MAYWEVGINPIKGKNSAEPLVGLVLRVYLITTMVSTIQNSEMGWNAMKRRKTSNRETMHVVFLSSRNELEDINFLPRLMALNSQKMTINLQVQILTKG